MVSVCWKMVLLGTMHSSLWKRTFMKMILKTCEGVPRRRRTSGSRRHQRSHCGGEFISHMHTFQNLSIFPSLMQKIIDRNNFDGWMAQGGKDIVERSYERAIEMIENGKPKMPLPEDTKKSTPCMCLKKRKPIRTKIGSPRR